MKKVIVVLLSIIILVYVSSPACYAMNTSYMENENLFSEEGKAVFEYAVKNREERLESLDSKWASEYAYAYKIHLVKGSVVEAIDNNNLESVFYHETPILDNGPNGTIWAVVKKDNNCDFFFRSEDGEIERWRSSVSLGEAKNIDFDKVEAALESLGTNFKDKNLTIKCVSMRQYCISYAVYIRYDNEEYLIPCNLADFLLSSEYEEGKLYKVDELRNLFEEVEGIEPKPDHTIVYVIVSIIVVLLSVLLLFVIRKKHKRELKQ